MSVFFTQQRRKLAEAPARDWPTLRDAILAARGARESADVGDEEAERAFQAKRAAEEAAMWAGARNMTPEEQAEYAFGHGMQQATPEAVASMAEIFEPSIAAFFHRMLFGEPIDYSEDRLP